MPRPVGYGRPNTPVFPPGWSESAAAVLAATLECTVKVGSPSTTGVWSEADRRTVSGQVPPAYDGPASIRPAATDPSSEPVVAEDQVTIARYEVALPQPTPGIEPGHVVDVISSPDEALVGRRLTVVRVEYGDRRFTRLLFATLND